jgi:tellurite resistance protein
MTRSKSATPSPRARTGNRSRTGARTTRAATARLSIDRAIIAVLIGAMDANGHVAREELARAHHIIWSMRRFRRKSGDHVNRLIESMRTLIEARGALPVIADAASVIPQRLRAPAFALAADLVLADGRMERSERRFLDRLAGELDVDPQQTIDILEVMLVKNSA